MRSDLPQIVVGIPTRGRPAVLHATLAAVAHQSRQAERTIICHVEPGDLPDDAAGLTLTSIQASAGLCRQRNAILAAATDADILVFFDDDFLPARGYLEAIATAFAIQPDIVVGTGHVIADGARGPGFDVEQAHQLIEHDRYDGPWPGIVPAWNGYGCNMAIRLSVAREARLAFDERLMLYAWYEDIDFSRRLSRFGRVVRVEGARGVHLGAKSGRVSGRRLGYSQVVNPVYLWRKGTYPASHALRSVARHLAMNSTRALWPEPYVDRRGRLAGNGLGLVDLLLGRVRPERILDL